jgi:hypothetical protein
LEAIYFQVWQSADTPLGIDREFSGYPFLSAALSLSDINSAACIHHDLTLTPRTSSYPSRCSSTRLVERTVKMAAKMGNNYPLTNQAMDLAVVPSRASANEITAASVPHAGDVETGSVGDSSTKEKFEAPSDEVVQDGVKQAKAITATWSRKNLYTAYAL